MIRILEKHVADKIAAGEVIDRPVSIVKELLENALDAGASQITVEIKNGGKSYIRVTDNGCGIPAEEAEIAFQRHATSKIVSAEDLDAVGTLGFRGEALASICAVSRAELITKIADARSGRRIVVEGSRVLENTAMGCPDGTTVTVRDLFYNVPARSKFLASDSSETRRITDMVSRIALSYGDVKFTLINGGSRVFSTSGKGSILNNISNIYGFDAAKDLLPVERMQNGYVLKGFVSAPSSSMPSRSKQIFCVNGRVVSSQVLEKALEGAYKERMFQGRFPAAFLFLALPASQLDVNVHPTKKEIRFEDPFETADFVKTAVKESIAVKEALPQIRVESIGTKERTMVPDVPGSFLGADGGDASPGVSIQTSQSKLPRISVQEDQVDIKNILTTIRSEETPAGWEETSELPSRPFDFETLHFMGALFHTYIMACDEDSFYLIDQHAAHERIFYERLMEQYNNREKLQQTLLIPLRFDVSAQMAASEELWLHQISCLGYDIELFGANTYLVREIPAFMELREAEDFLHDLFRSLEDKPDMTNRSVRDRIITRACKSAVKGGDALADEEIAALIRDLRSCKDPFSCPHGRPTFIRMKKYEIEKMFKRV